ncbi:hypothetical protein HYFRA_00005117 [Hymenoscyphus fraxineus]|uniref:Uncharacterized protein n=1 Tax=Hymenoscyphus fraxineus TaxID=746836 RepID=A0A9N9PPK2_9HELO|nr:hypothetical protein HYFRA_00005117 [Hymenoscyphus fraxineus]
MLSTKGAMHAIWQDPDSMLPWLGISVGASRKMFLASQSGVQKQASNSSTGKTLWKYPQQYPHDSREDHISRAELRIASKNYWESVDEQCIT